MRKTKHDYNFDRLFRQFKRKIIRSGKLEDYRNRQHYKKPSTKRQEKMNAAKRRAVALQKANSLGPEPRLPTPHVRILPPKE
jgi:ribosomal protein S21